MGKWKYGKWGPKRNGYKVCKCKKRPEFSPEDKMCDLMKFHLSVVSNLRLKCYSNKWYVYFMKYGCNGTLLQYSCLETHMDRVGHDWATSLSLFIFMHWRRKWQPTPVNFPGESHGRGSLVSCCLRDSLTSWVSPAAKIQGTGACRCHRAVWWCEKQRRGLFSTHRSLVRKPRSPLENETSIRLNVPRSKAY